MCFSKSLLAVFRRMYLPGVVSAGRYIRFLLDWFRCCCRLVITAMSAFRQSQRIVTGLLLTTVCLCGCAQTPRPKPPSVSELYERASRIAAQSESGLQTAIAHRPADSDPLREAPSRGVVLASRQKLLASPESASPAAASVLVSEFFEDTDLQEALQILAQQADVPLVVGEQVGGRTSAYIEDMPFEDALRQVLMPLGYVFRYRDGAYYIGALDSQSNLFRYIAVEYGYQPVYLEADELKEMLPESLQQFVRVSGKRHMIRVEAPREVADDILSRLEDYDLPVPQVVMEALVCVISPNESSQFGMDSAHAVTDNGSDLLNLGLDGLLLGGTISPYGVRNALSDFAQTSAFVRLLAQEGYLAIRAAPRVMARDGEKAAISIARENYFAVQPTGSDVTDIFVRQEIQQVESGIALELTPTILGDRITVQIDKAEVSEDVQFGGPTSVVNNPYPQINRRTVSTTVEVRDGETIVIGGLVQKQTVDRVTQVPGLCKLPGLGKMFTTIERQDEEAEIVIFISPRLVYRSRSNAPEPQPLDSQVLPPPLVPPATDAEFDGEPFTEPPESPDLSLPPLEPVDRRPPKPQKDNDRPKAARRMQQGWRARESGKTL